MKKKLLMYDGIGALRCIRQAYAKVFQHIGWEVYLHDQENPQLSPLDLYNKFEPDVVFTGSYQLGRPDMKAILQRPNLRFVMFAPNYGDFDKQIHDEKHQVLCVTKEELQNLEILHKTHNLRNVFTYYHQNWVNRTHNFYNNLGLEPIGLHLAADIFDYPTGKYNDKLASDVAFVGGAWSYKGINFRKYLYPLCNTNLSVKIFGGGHHPVPQHIGSISTTHMKDLFFSSKVCPAVYEPLANLGFDVSERIYKVLSSGGFCVSQYVQSAVEDIFTNNEVVFAEKNNPQDFIDKCMYYVKNPEKRLPFLENALKYVKSDGTYLHRSRKLFEVLGWFDETLKINTVLGLQ